MDALTAMSQIKIIEANKKFLKGETLTDEELRILTTRYYRLVDKIERILMELRRRRC